MKRKRTFRWLLGVAGIVLVASESFSFALGSQRIHGYLVARLAAAMGRPVEVGEFSFSVLDGFRIEASPITVGEDPRFGSEYFLRADKLTASPRWGSLLHRRFEFGTLSFSHPSLNLTRAPDGRWNLESWLPPPSPVGPRSPGAAASGALLIAPGHLYKIEIDGGRLNFKFGDDKSPFALAGARGVLEQETPGRWRVDFEARPMRATVGLQQAGTIHVFGRIAGTSARLQPAELSLTWQQGSLADVLRLARDRDYGVRGNFSLELNARIAPASAPLNTTQSAAAGGAQWRLQAAIRLSGMHRWDLAQRDDNPSVNLLADFVWQRGSNSLELSRCVLEAPHSSIRGLGRAQWAPAFSPELHLLASAIDFRDLLAWYRAFHPGVAEDLKPDGLLGMDVSFKGWPLQLERGLVESPGGTLNIGQLPAPMSVGALSARVKHGQLELDPVSFWLGSARSRAATAVRFQGTLSPPPLQVNAGSLKAGPGTWSFELRADGEIERVEDVFAAARALGQRENPSWRAGGRVNLKAGLRGIVRPFEVQPMGSMDLNSIRIRTPYLNQPVVLANAKVEWKLGGTVVTLQSARAFGALWRGSLRKKAQSPWTIDLSAQRLDLADLDRWLNPSPRALQPQGAARPSSEVDAAIASLRGAGKIEVGELILGTIRAERVRGKLAVDGREIQFQADSGAFYKGALSGSVHARLSPQPAYDVKLKFDRVDLASLSDASVNYRADFAGTAGGAVELQTHGARRQELVNALEGRGFIEVRSAQFRGLDLESSFALGSARAGASRFSNARAEFSLGQRRFQIERARLVSPGDDWNLRGAVDFSRSLDLQLWRESAARTRPQARESSLRFSITGPLAEPQWGPAPPRVKMR